MANIIMEKLQEGAKIIFQHQIGEAGDIAQEEKLGVIVNIGDPMIDYHVKVRILGTDEDIFTYIEPQEIRQFV